MPRFFGHTGTLPIAHPITSKPAPRLRWLMSRGFIDSAPATRQGVPRGIEGGGDRIMFVAGRMTLHTYLHYRTPVRWAIGSVVAVLLVAGSWADHLGYFSGPTGEVRLFEGHPFEVVKVVDRDTIDVRDKHGRAVWVRFWGLDTPEVGEPFAAQATAFIQRWCYGRQVSLELQAHHIRGKFGRLLAYVRLEDGTLLNERLLASGLARADLRFVHQWLDRFGLMERQARFDRVDLWSTQ